MALIKAWRLQELKIDDDNYEKYFWCSYEDPDLQFPLAVLQQQYSLLQRFSQLTQIYTCAWVPVLRIQVDIKFVRI